MGNPLKREKERIFPVKQVKHLIICYNLINLNLFRLGERCCLWKSGGVLLGKKMQNRVCGWRD